MRLVFGVISLLVVLGLVSWLARVQLARPAPTPAVAAEGLPVVPQITTREQAQAVQQQVVNDVNQALKDAAAARASAVDQ
jgi:hypothetical protein